MEWRRLLVNYVNHLRPQSRFSSYWAANRKQVRSNNNNNPANGPSFSMVRAEWRENASVDRADRVHSTSFLQIVTSDRLTFAPFAQLESLSIQHRLIANLFDWERVFNVVRGDSCSLFCWLHEKLDPRKRWKCKSELGSETERRN